MRAESEVHKQRTKNHPGQRVLGHLARKMKSWPTGDCFLEVLQHFVRFACRTPEELVKLDSYESSEPVQCYADSLARAGYGLRTANLYADALVAFFRANGHRKERELEVEMHHIPGRYWKTEQYVPSKEEAWGIANS